MMVRDSVWLIDWSSTTSDGEAAVGLEALADTVEHHDGVVQRVADDREDRRDHRQIERRLRHGEEAEHEDRVVQHGEDGAERQPPGVEAEGDVDEDQQQRERQRPDGAGLAARCRPAGPRRPAARPARSGSTAFSASSSLRARSRRSFCFGSGGRRMAMSREEPKFCTCGSWKPAAASLRAHRIDVRPRCAKFASRADAAGEVDARGSGRGCRTRRTTTIISTADSVYHTLRVAMNGKLVCLLKEFHCDLGRCL